MSLSPNAYPPEAFPGPWPSIRLTFENPIHVQNAKFIKRLSKRLKAPSTVVAGSMVCAGFASALEAVPTLPPSLRNGDDTSDALMLGWTVGDLTTKGSNSKTHLVARIPPGLNAAAVRCLTNPVAIRVALGALFHLGIEALYEETLSTDSNGDLHPTLLPDWEERLEKLTDASLLKALWAR